MLAGNRQIRARNIRVNSLNSELRFASLINHSVPRHAHGHIVLHLARHCTRIATSAAIQIDSYSQPSHSITYAFLTSMSVSLKGVTRPLASAFPLGLTASLVTFCKSPEPIY